MGSTEARLHSRRASQAFPSLPCPILASCARRRVRQSCLQTMETLASVLLKPGEADRIVAGHPWIYQGSILRLTAPRTTSRRALKRISTRPSEIGSVTTSQPIFSRPSHLSNVLALPHGDAANIDCGLISELSRREVKECEDLVIAVFDDGLAP